MRTVVVHAKEFREFHKRGHRMMQQINKQVLVYHQEAERREQRRRERMEKDRLRALKVMYFADMCIFFCHFFSCVPFVVN